MNSLPLPALRTEIANSRCEFGSCDNDAAWPPARIGLDFVIAVASYYRPELQRMNVGYCSRSTALPRRDEMSANCVSMGQYKQELTLRMEQFGYLLLLVFK